MFRRGAAHVTPRRRSLPGTPDVTKSRANASPTTTGPEYFDALAAEGALVPDLLRIHVGMVIQTMSADRVFEDAYHKHGFSSPGYEPPPGE